jgi:glutamate decarboxylase
LLDGQARLNLATFVTTYMPAVAARLMADTRTNMIDKDEYPQTAEIEARCVNILAAMWNSPTTSRRLAADDWTSEAAMLGGLALLPARADAKAASRPTARTW